MELFLHHVPDNLAVQEFSTKKGHKKFANDNRLPKTKLRNDETIKQCLMRCLTEKLSIKAAIAERIADDAVLLRAEEEETTGTAARSIPNIYPSVQKLIVSIRLKNVDSKIREALGLHTGSLFVDKR